MNSPQDRKKTEMVEDSHFLDLHVHSTHSSDGEASLKELFKQATKIGLRGFALTDHNAISGWREARELAKEHPDIIFVPGVEVTTVEGHVLALNIREEVKRELPIPETIERIHAQGGIAVAAHPYRLWSGIGEKATLDNIQHFDAVEGFNARNIFSGNRKSRALALKTGKPETGGSDCHIFPELGGGYTVFRNPVETVEDVIEEILKGCTLSGSGHFGRVTGGKIFRQGAHSVSEWFKRGFRDI